MIAFFESKTIKNQYRYLISDITDISTEDKKQDNPYIAAKKIILDYLRSLDNQNLHFGMLLFFVFFNINKYLKKIRKNENFTLQCLEKREKMLISVISDI